MVPHRVRGHPAAQHAQGKVVLPRVQEEPEKQEVGESAETKKSEIDVDFDRTFFPFSEFSDL